MYKVIIALTIPTLFIAISLSILVYLVSKHSLKLKALISLNSSYQQLFADINRTEPLTCSYICKSKAALDKLNLRNYTISEIEEHLHFYTEVLHAMESHQIEYDHYLTKQNHIKNDASLDIYRSFITHYIESYLLSFHSLKLKNKLQMQVVATYTSPKRRNYYTKEITYSISEAKSLHQEAIQQLAYKKSRQHQIKLERAKMSAGLRYDILKRDNFRCRLCGASSKDDVQLHVDHIHPVSKGGKTTPANLQTLCDRCNRGKSNKL